MDKDLSRVEIQEKLGLSDKKNFKENYLSPALEDELIEMTIPEKPSSRHQKYRLTQKGKALLSR
jgi:ATP-dependent DNA helicase RecG